MKTLTCSACGSDWEVAPSRGRYPSRCPECRDAPAPAPVVVPVLSDEERRVLRTATSIGRGARTSELAAIRGLTVDEVGVILDRLVALGLLRVWGYAPTDLSAAAVAA